MDAFQNTTVSGIYTCGDNTTHIRPVANAVVYGVFAGGMANKEMIDEEF